MPAKNSIKQYVEGGYYHIYNRGVEKRNIFEGEKDYLVFLRFLKEYLLPLNHPDLKRLQGINPRRKPINCHHLIELVAYCLMPNHFHLLLKQISPDGLKTFMKALATNYVMYFNHKDKNNIRVGPLFQGIYKAVLVETEPQFLHLSRYIHSNPKELLARDQPLYTYPYSSYADYLGMRNTEWLQPEGILSMFRSAMSALPKDILSYQSFVENHEIDEKELLGSLLLE